MRTILMVAAICWLSSMAADAHVVAGLIVVDGEDQVNEDRAYDEGTKAMNDGRWSDAEVLFRHVADMKGKRADGAIYWEAYAQDKEGNTGRAISTCKALSSEYAQSKWRGECDAMLAEYRKPVAFELDARARADVYRSGSPEDEIKMLALNSLMHQEPEKALPIVKNILQSSTQSPQLKERALFVLAQSQSKEAQDVIDQIARGKMDPDLQIRAIRMMSAMKGKESAGFLNEIYSGSQDERVKEAALDGMFISGDSHDLIALAKAESDATRKRKIVSKLSMMHGKDVTDYMEEILSK